MPGWLMLAVAIATPLLAFAGAAVGHVLSRRSARELEVWRRREETMRMLRWAAEQAMQDGPTGLLGIEVLISLGDSDLVQPADRDIVNTTLFTLVELADDHATPRRAYTDQTRGDDHE